MLRLRLVLCRQWYWGSYLYLRKKKITCLLLHESVVKILCMLCTGASSKDNFTKMETASTEVATSSSVPVSPEEKFCFVCVNKHSLLLEKKCSRHLLTQQSWVLIQYCAEVSLILKKYLANSPMVSYYFLCLFLLLKNFYITVF